MSWTDSRGVAIESPIGPRLSTAHREDREKVKDLVILGLRQQGWTWKEISQFLSSSPDESTVRRRYHRMPKGIRNALVRSASK
jgi:hypothetical protein